MIDKLHGADSGKNNNNKTKAQEQKNFTGMINIGNFSGRQDDAHTHQDKQENEDAVASAPQDAKQKQGGNYTKRDSLQTKVPDSNHDTHRHAENKSQQDSQKTFTSSESASSSSSSSSESSSNSEDESDDDEGSESESDDEGFGKKKKGKRGKRDNNSNLLGGSAIISDNMSEDSHWVQNEQIFQNFQENMALIAGNSFEIL